MTDFSIAELTSSTGAKLAVRHMKASKAKAVVQINHGLAEHSERYQRFAKALAKAGYHSYAHDHRGHGFTSSADAPQGTFSNSDGIQKTIKDMHFINAHIKKTHPDLPIILFGHSMGAILGTNYAIEHSDTIDGAALWNFNVDGGVLVSILTTLLKIERALKGSDVPSNLAKKMTFDDWNRKFKPNRTDFDWLSRDETEVDRYIADPLCGFPASIGLWIQLTGAIQNAANDAQLAKIRTDLPINLLGGEDDPSSMKGQSLVRLQKRLQKLGHKDNVCKTLPGARHETLNETNRDKETASFINWLDEHWG